MTLSIDTLHDYLWSQFGITPKSVQLDTHFRHDLQLTDSDINNLVRHVSNSVGYSFPDTLVAVSQVANVFDLIAYVLLRAPEGSDLPNYFGEPVWPIDGLPASELLSFSKRVDQRSNLN